ncbi:MAG: AsmA-like C-terminal region-containing protein [Paludibacter sp.]|jgi:hypothetical protein|nr:AsmA-like C-terminal region-containing protein [Paludibacter sp.]
MNRTVKIILISFVSLLVVLLISISVLLWVVFTPERLTPIVQKQLKNYISCPAEIKDVELTFFSSFPQFALRIDGITLVNPTEGAQNDTLLSSAVLKATVDVREFVKNNKVIITDVLFENLRANLFSDATGRTNFDVFISDTTAQDSSAFENPFELIKLDKVAVENANISYIDLKSKMSAAINNLDAEMLMNMKKSVIDLALNASTPKVSFKTDSTVFLNNADVELKIPALFDMDKMHLTLNKSEILINGLTAGITGEVNLKNDIITDLQFHTSEYPVKDLLALVPAEYLTALEGMNLSGNVSSKGTVKGTFNNNSMPVIDVVATMNKGTFAYSALPVKLREMNGDLRVLLDLNNDSTSHIVINRFSTLTGNSRIEAKGLIDHIMLDDMLFDLNLKMGLSLADLKPFLPEGMNMSFSGMANGNASTKFLLSDAMNANIEKMNITGWIDASNLRIDYDSLSMQADKAQLRLSKPQSKQYAFLNADLRSPKLNVQQGKNIKATLHNVNMTALTSDLMKTDKLNQIKLNFDFDQMKAGISNMTTALQKTKGDADIAMNFSDTVSWPTVDCNFDISKLNFAMDSTLAEIYAPKGSLKMKSAKGNPADLLLDIVYSGKNTTASMGKEKITASDMNMDAAIAYKPNEKNTMLQWEPNGFVSMYNADIETSEFAADISLPILEMNFTPDAYNIKNAKLLVDDSDFELTGKLWNVDEYMKNKGLLKGEFKFHSELTDVYRLMDLTSGFGEEDTTLTAAEQISKDSASAASGPFMVPKGIDITLDAQINKVQLGFDSARNLLGNIYVRDGLLVLQDLRFNTSAARMQLTAMYRTPRRNHLFVGFDYHMTNTEISELLKTIPDIDSIMPMLRSFGGKGEFHIAAEAYTDSAYNVKKSTIRGVASIKGENLVLMDGETFSEIAKTLRFSKQAKNKVDSLSAEFTIFRNEVDVYPFQIVMDKYKAVVGGRHNLDMSFDYHISVTDSPLPIQLGVDVKGTMDKMRVLPAKCKYARLYRPVERREIDTRQLEIRKMIRDALTSKVKD